jgi:anion-transporting  ArsA/GET3 family ATPase
LKDPTPNFSSQAFTLLTKEKRERLSIVTGKGGVGKTLFSLALTHSLKAQGLKVKYLSFEDRAPSDLIQTLSLPELKLDSMESAKIYIGEKLKSQTLAGWITSSTFFKSVFHMVPALSDLVMLGHILDMLDRDPLLHLVVDLPSTGHAIAIFESPQNFKDIFGSGILVKDIDRMYGIMSGTNFAKLYILTIPTILAVEEARELYTQIHQRQAIPIVEIMNQSLSHLPLEEETHPFIRKKWEIEKMLLNDKQSFRFVPYSSFHSSADIVKELSLSMQKEGA